MFENKESCKGKEPGLRENRVLNILIFEKKSIRILFWLKKFKDAFLITGENAWFIY
jgi:hypothetical protein